jgi:hypothetical protein
MTEGLSSFRVWRELATPFLCVGWAEMQGAGQGQKQIPCGNDRKKGKNKGKGKGSSRFPAGMTERKARTKAKARATAKADRFAGMDSDASEDGGGAGRPVGR